MKREKQVVTIGPHLKLSGTRLCVQCETLYPQGERCPVCGSTGMPLTHWVPTCDGVPVVRRIPPVSPEVA